MAPDSDNKTGPRVRVRIPTISRGGSSGGQSAGPGDANGALEGGHETGQGVSPKQVADQTPAHLGSLRGRVDDRARRLTFELEIGELPNVLQFLSTDRRTGKLDLTVRNQPNAGYVYFEDGAVYLARYRTYEGVEALARVVNAGRVRAVFTNSAKANERNVDIPVSALLLEVLVRADELVASGETEQLPSARQFRVSASGSPVDAASGPDKRDLQQPPAKAPPGKDASPASDDERARPRGDAYTLSARSRASAEDRPGDRQRLSLRRKAVAPDGYQPGRKRRRPILRRLFLLALQTAVIAGALTGGYVAYRQFVAGRNDRWGPLGGAAPGVDVRPAELDAARLKSMLKHAHKAVGGGDYIEAERLVEQVLLADPANVKALELRDLLDRADAPRMASKLATTAALKVRDAMTMRDYEWAAEDIMAVQGLLKSATELHQAGNHESAVKAFRTVIAAGEKLLGKRVDYTAASAKNKLAAAQRKKAEEAGAAEYMPDLWKQAVVAENEALDHFASSSFSRAVARWAAAADLFEAAAEQAEARAEINRLSKQFTRDLASCEGLHLSPKASDLAGEASALADEAERLLQEGEITRSRSKWREAMKVLQLASSTANIAANRSHYVKHVERATAAAQNGDWQAAKAAYTEALAIPGFADDAVALKGLFSAEKAGLLEDMSAAAGNGRWQEAKHAADELLKIDQANAVARDVLARAKQYLVVRLSLQAVYAGKPVVGARAAIGGDPDPHLLPETVELQLDEDYHIRIWAPPRGNTYFDSYATIYEAKKPGPDSLVVQLKAAQGPEKNKGWRVPGLNMDMVYLRPGTFDMGSERRKDEQPLRKVTITRHFWMGASEVTNMHYRDFLEESGYDGSKAANSGYLRHFGGASAMSDERNYPVCYISWKNAMAFAEWLTIRERDGERLPEGYCYRLPTEAEWEYVASEGGRISAVDLEQRGWYMKNSKANQATQQLKKSSWGLYDMFGNVWEMCYDYYGRYRPGPVSDPTGPKRGVLRVMRGGSHSNPDDLCRPGYRSSIGWTDCRANVGFRIVLAPTFEELAKPVSPSAIVKSEQEE